MHAQEFLGLRATHNPHRWYLPVERKLCVRQGFLFGGCGLAAAVTALEATTGRPLVWATAQYLSYARTPSVLDLDVIVPVSGRHTTQARAIGLVGDQEIFTLNAALGSRTLEIAGQWAQMPDVPPPDDCPRPPAFPDSEGTIHDQVELRVAHGRYGRHRDGTPSADGRSALWIRLPRELDRSAAGLAIVADWVPSGIGQALGRWAGGNSLDNTIRILDLVPTDCVDRSPGLRAGWPRAARPERASTARRSRLRPAGACSAGPAGTEAGATGPLLAPPRRRIRHASTPPARGTAVRHYRFK